MPDRCRARRRGGRARAGFGRGGWAGGCRGLWSADAARSSGGCRGGRARAGLVTGRCPVPGVSAARGGLWSAGVLRVSGVFWLGRGGWAGGCQGLWSGRCGSLVGGLPWRSVWAGLVGPVSGTRPPVPGARGPTAWPVVRLRGSKAGVRAGRGRAPAGGSGRGRRGSVRFAVGLAGSGAWQAAVLCSSSLVRSPGPGSGGRSASGCGPTRSLSRCLVRSVSVPSWPSLWARRAREHGRL